MVTEEKVKEAVAQVIDPEIRLNVVDLGFIYGIEVEEGNVDIKMTLTTRGCPLHQLLSKQVEEVVHSIEGVKSVKVNLVWDPPWSPKMMTDSAKKFLGFRDDMMEE
ncbi:MAG: DUF59 domain-containing protein [candidate division Zixibacteria bacterium]|nr:DUF59 domain-containing protein [Candidatus Tariuqbacter arcticus]